MFDADVIVIGSGGGGAVAAKELGEAGLKVLVLEAGAWYGNKHWANPNSEHGGDWSSDYKDLDIGIYKKVFNSYENNMNDVVSGVFRFGPADRRRTPLAPDYAAEGGHLAGLRCRRHDSALLVTVSTGFSPGH